MSEPLPDLSTPEGRATYQAELARVARGWRWTGLSLVIAGALLFLSRKESWSAAAHEPLGQLSIALIAIGWAITLTGLVKRTRHHARRMAGK